MSSENSTAQITRRSLADAFDACDNQIAAVNNAKREQLNAYRDQLSKEGHKPADVKAEIEACKVAIRKRRTAAKDPQAVDSRDALVDEIYDEISSPRAPRATHAREDEAASLPADASSSKRKEVSANPDAVSQKRSSGNGGARGRSEAPVGGGRSTKAAPDATPITRGDSPETPLQSDPVESAEPVMEARATYAVDPTDPSDPGPIPEILPRTPETRTVAQ